MHHGLRGSAICSDVSMRCTMYASRRVPLHPLQPLQSLQPLQRCSHCSRCSDVSAMSSPTSTTIQCVIGCSLNKLFHIRCEQMFRPHIICATLPHCAKIQARATDRHHSPGTGQGWPPSAPTPTINKTIIGRRSLPPSIAHSGSVSRIHIFPP